MNDIEAIISILESQIAPALDEILLAHAGSLPKGLQRDVVRVQGVIEDLLYTLEHSALDAVA